MISSVFIYGTLQPGGPNHHVMQAINGTWHKAHIRGTLKQDGWGADMGYPGLVLDPAADKIEGYVFQSDNLSEKWSELDAFEGDGYQRVLTQATLETGDVVETYVYALA